MIIEILQLKDADIAVGHGGADVLADKTEAHTPDCFDGGGRQWVWRPNTATETLRLIDGSRCPQGVGSRAARHASTKVNIVLNCFTVIPSKKQGHSALLIASTG